MEDINKDLQDVHETPEGDPTPQDGGEETPTNEGDELTPEQREELEKKAKASSQNYERAKKAEEELKKLKESKDEEKPTSSDDLTNKDVIFLAKADIHEDDVDEVLEWAKFKKVSVSEAYKQMKTTLDVRAEERKTANATNTQQRTRGTSKTDGEDILQKAESTGEVPTSAKDMDKLAEARMARLKAKAKN